MEITKGYKVMNSDMTCKGFKYEIGKTYKHDGKIGICYAGFHFCKKAVNCFKYYDFKPDNIVCEIEASGKIIDADDKSVTNKIKIIKKLNWHEILDIVNIGNNNTGYRNSGDYNSGDYNSGNHNSGNHNSGIFCTEKVPKIKIFDVESNMTIYDWNNSKLKNIINSFFILNKWISYEYLTEEEKSKYPNGYLKTFTYEEAWNNLWYSITDEEKQLFYELPNFNADKFEEITGIKINNNKGKK